MKISDISRGFKALSMLSALAVSAILATSPVMAQTSTPSKAAQRVLNAPLTKAQQNAKAQEGANFGKDTLDSAEQKTLDTEEGGPKGAGCTKIGGKCVDNEELMGRGYDQSRVDKADTVDGKMSNLKGYYDEESKRTTANDGVEGAAYKTAEDSADAKVIGRREVANTNWDLTNNSLAEGRAGSAQGMGFEQCTTTTTVTPGTNPDAYIKEQQVCEIVNTPGDAGGVICTRERIPTPSQGTEGGETEAYLGTPSGANEDFCQRSTTLEPYSVNHDFIKTGELEISAEVGGLACTRNRWAEMVTTTEDKEKTASLGVNTESGGLSCSRLITPSNGSTIQPQTRTADLPIDNQAGGNLCKREVWPVATSTPTSGTKTALLTVNTESGGMSCTRTVWPTNATTTTAVSQDATLIVDAQTGGNLCKRDVWPTNSTTSVAGGKSATIGVNDETGGLSCTRTIWPTSGSTTTATSATATLTVDLQSAGNLCKREVWPVNSTTTTGGSKTVNIGVNTEAGGVSCTRTVWPTSSTTTTAVSHDAVLSIDTQSSTNLCTREVWPTNGSANAYGEQNAVLSIDNQSGGLSCTRYRWVEGGSASSPGQSTSPSTTHPAASTQKSISWVVAPTSTTISAITLSVAHSSGYSPACFATSVSTAPTPANGNTITVTIYNIGFGGCPTTAGFLPQLTVTASFTGTSSSKTFSVRESGNCADTGTANCPTQWSCITNAPTTINSINVTQADVFGLATLYPGAGPYCTTGNLNRVCGGTATNSNSISIAGSLQAGTTAISGFAFTVNNPQVGVGITLTQTPSAANSWVAIFSVNRTDFSSAKVAPNIKMSWNATVPAVDVSTRDIGNCAQGGTTNCPAQWSCATSAPTTINGIAVTAAMTAQVAPLFPGAASSCARGQLNRVCAGTASTTTTVNLSSRMPAGTTSISSLSFSVLNPQAGVAVTMTSAPTAANGWIATFRIDRTTWASQPAQPNIRITWNATSPTTNVSVVDSGDCSDPGSAHCPTAWSCTNAAPFTVNGISVTAAMAATQAPLYPGASSSCVVGRLARTCSGSAAQTTSVSIAADLPAGTTSITNFQFVVNNPQSGVTVTLQQTPSAANSWVAIFNVNRTAWAATPAQPNLTLTWDATSPNVTLSLRDTGDCAAAGTANCAAQWSCQTPAPTTINGISVTAAMAGQLAPMYPGASSTCARGTRDKVCSGTASVNTSVNLASRMPAGTTTINNFAFTVTNPQSGVAVVLTQTPSAANGWIAIFRVDRTNWGITPVQPNINMTWNSVVPTTNLTVVDSGNCADAGTTNCPTSWACNNTAPFTVNGISVTAAMAATQAPLFPGASSSCVVGRLSRTCSGSANTTTAVSIADQIPAGTTSITGFAFTVTNPQAGITVALTSAPTVGNSWVATFTVTRTAWATAPVDPNLNMTWNATVPSVNVSTQETGNCGATGSTNCPATWACTNVAPTNINGIDVTAAMAAQVAPLFTGASSSCTRASLDKVCSGTASTTTTVSLAARMPAGTTSISGLTHTVLNPQAGVTVTMTGAPTAANNWVATFRVDRTSWATVPANPDIRITWNAATPTVNVSTVDNGNCSDPGSTTCPTSWSCTNSAPYTVNGISVTAAMAATQAPLFPSAASSCVVGSLNRVCSGSSTVGNTISIAAEIPAGVTSITGFGFTVQNPQAGVTVSLVSAPTQANGWTATFNVTRSNVQTPPAQPQITMSWNMSVPGVNVTVRDTGDCAASGTAQCPAVWSCTTSAPTTANGISVTTAMAGQVSPLFPGAAATCAAGSLDMNCSGSANTQTSISIASQLPAGVTTIQNFRFTVNNPQTGVAVTNTQVPSAANSWVAIFNVNRTDFSQPKASPNITMDWDAVVPTVNLSVVDTGNCGDVGSTACPTQWQCVSSAPTTVNGIAISASMAQTMAPLFPGAVDSCVKGDLSRVCSGSASVGTTVSVSDLVPAGITTINNFAFTVLNPQAGVTVSLVTPPTYANGWMATFNVARTNWSQTPVAPQVRVTFQVDVQNPQLTVQDTGDCNDPGSAACPTQWQCTQNAPTTINGIPVTVDMVTPLPPLFPSAPGTCTTGELKRVCGGSSAVQTTISIADQVVAGTQAINNFQWTHTNPDPAVTVTLVEAPTVDNGWVATFSVARDMAVPTVPAKPQITLTWSTTTTEHRAITTETGDCSERTAFVAPPTPSQSNSMLAKVGEFALDLVISKAMARIRICDSPEDAGCDGGGGGGTLPPGEPDPDTEPPPSPPSGGSCSIVWQCTQSLPGDIGGVPVTQAMLDERGPLFPGDGPPAQCLAATYQRQCTAQGDTSSGVTEISIAEFLVPGTQAITNYTWTLIEPGAGVSVQSLEDPSLGNNWMAKFKVTRTDYSIAPVPPKVRLTWDMPGEVTWEFPVTETGDCSQGVEDEFCTTEWTCDDQAPEPTRPLEVCGHVTTPWYNGAEAQGGAGPIDKAFNLQSFLTAETAAITKFKYAVQTPVGGCTVGVTPFPPPVTAMNVTAVTEASTVGTLCKPMIRFEWDNLCPDADWTPPTPPGGGWGPRNPGHRWPNAHQQLAALNPTQKFLAAIEKVGNALLPSAQAAICVTCDYEGGGGYWDGGDIADEPPLFPGDGPPATCMKATKTQNCEGTWTGTECTINSEGVEVCVTVDPDTPPNNDCPALEEDPDCELVREECTDGAMSSSGWCYVKSRLYECKRKLPGGGAPDPVITETTTCNGESAAGVTLPAVCQDGSCNTQQEQESVGMSKAGAKMVLLQHVMNDTNKVPGTGTPGGGGTGPGDPGNPQQQVMNSKDSSIGDMLLGLAGIGTANAQTVPFDPFQIPPGMEETDQDPTDGTGGLEAGVLAGMNIRFFAGKKRDCMKALGGLLNCCKKTPPIDQAPKLWDFMKKNLMQSNNAKGRESEADNGPDGFLSMIQGASHQDLMKMFTSNLTSLMGGGDGGDENTDSTMGKSYQDFMRHEITVEKPKLAWYCDNDEFELAVGKQTGTCTHLGSFCQTRVLGMCIIKKDRYCCFNSPITRIIRENMDQSGIADLGTAKRPQCDGVTVEQVSRMNLDNIDTNEVEGRMAQGMFNIDIGALANMNFSDLQSMFDGANSLIGDPTRQNPSDRNQSYVDQTDTSGAYSSILGNQSGYRPETVETEASDGTIGLDTLDRDISRGIALTLNVVRSGTKGAVTVRVWTENGTATAGTHYTAIDTNVTFFAGQEGPKKVLLKTIRLNPNQLPVPRQSLKVNIAIVAGNATLTGNSQATIWLSGEN